MAISADDAIDKFGTQDTVTAGGGTAAVTNTSVAASGDVVTWTNDGDAPLATAVLTFQYPSGTLAAAPYVILHMRKMDVDGTGDEPQPSATHKRPVAVFNINPSLAATTNSSNEVEIALPNGKTSQDYQFYVENRTGVTMTAGWTLKITPKTIGPHA